MKFFKKNKIAWVKIRTNTLIDYTINITFHFEQLKQPQYRKRIVMIYSLSNPGELNEALQYHEELLNNSVITPFNDEERVIQN